MVRMIFVLQKIKGSLKRHESFWKFILKADYFILSIIESGYRIPFRYIPASYSLKNDKSSFNNSSFVESTITDLIQNNLIMQVNSPLFINPLSVAESNSGKKRLILDLSYLNEFIWKEKIKFDDWKIFEEFIDNSETPGYLFKFEFKKWISSHRYT